MKARLDGLNELIGRLFDRRDPRVLLGITVVTIAGLLAGAVMAFAMRPSPQPTGPSIQVAARASATPPLQTSDPTPFAFESVAPSVQPQPSPAAATPTVSPRPAATDSEPEPMPGAEYEPDPTPTPDPLVDLQVGNQPSDLPGVAGYRIVDGDGVVQTLQLSTQDLDQSKCRVTQSYDPDHPDLPDRSISLPATSEQEVLLKDGSHTFEARCPSVVGTISARVRVIAMDGRPEACEGFEFVRDDITASTYEELTVGILDAWQGCVSTPWTPMYQVTVIFNADGTYSAYTREELDGMRMIALYYGTDEDSPLKKYAITDYQASGLGVGEIDIPFDGKSAIRDDLRNIRLMGENLEFEMFHEGRYGPLTFQLQRIVGP